jgi:crotonobetainyl-CoA:carnitine CoA-transferase CaiB-like acyl-CoA transferase
MSTAGNGPLSGIRVVDLTSHVLGPVATQTLGDMGADVIKVETPDGDFNRGVGCERSADMGALYMTMNRNKRSVVLNLKRPGAFAALMRMIEKADVFVHCMRTPAAERLGISYKALSARNPRLIYASGRGYRSDGPYRDRPAYDDVIQGAAGLASLNAAADGEPRYFPTVMVDKYCGIVMASTIAMALYARERTGAGQEIQVPMFETILSFMLTEHLWTGVFEGPQARLGYPRVLTPYRKPYRTKDGYMCLLASTDDQWRKLFGALERPELAADDRYGRLAERAKNFGDVYAIVEQEMLKRTNAEWQQAFDAADLPSAPLGRIEDMPKEPYLRDTGFFHHYSHPTEGALVTTSIPVSLSRTPASIRRAPPRLGEHTEEVLREYGCSAQEIVDAAS